MGRSVINYLIFALLLGCITGCSNGFNEFESDDVEGIVSEKSLHIFNKNDVPIWYAAFERESVATIFWVPTSTDENRIEAKGKKSIALKDILSFSRGDEIILYYWSSEEPEGDEMGSIIIQTE